MVLRIFARLTSKQKSYKSNIKMIEVQYDALRNSVLSETGEENWQEINRLISLMAEGFQLSLKSVLSGEELEDALLWCLNRRLRFKYVNGKPL